MRIWAKAILFYFSALIVFCQHLPLFAQTSGYILQMNCDPADSPFSKRFKIAQSYPDSLSIIAAMNKALSEAQLDGFLLAEIANLTWHDKQATATLQLNNQYQLLQLGDGNISQQTLQQAGFKERIYSNVPFNLPQLQLLFKNLLSVYENNGYPFASVWLGSLQITGENISAKLFSDKKQYFIFDSLIIAGNASISKSFLQSYLGIKQGSAYSEANLRNLEKHILELGFVESVKSPEVAFAGGKATTTLYLAKKNSNQFDGILGFMPNSNNGKLQLTGDLRLNLQNAFKHAESIGLNFKGLPKQSRELGMAINLPGTFSGSVGISAGFNLFKQDTSYQNANLKAGLSYRMNSSSSIQFFIDRQSGNLISTQGFKNAVALPAFADLNTTLYGLGLQIKNLDYRFNPTKGFSLAADAAAGRKIVKRNFLINPELYKNVNLNPAQYRLQSRADIFIPLGKASTINLANQTGLLIGKDLFDNELYRLGGFNSLRGFDEQSIPANAYSFINVEYRYLLERNSFLFVFVNQAFISRHTAQSNNKSYPLGLGTGIDFEIKAGIVSLSYALGEQHNTSLNMQSGKIHFGIIALF